MREQGRGAGARWRCLAAARRPVVLGARPHGSRQPQRRARETHNAALCCVGAAASRRHPGPWRYSRGRGVRPDRGGTGGPFSRRAPQELKPLCGEESLSCEQLCGLQSVSQSFLAEPLGPEHDGGCAHPRLHGAAVRLDPQPGVGRVGISHQGRQTLPAPVQQTEPRVSTGAPWPLQTSL